MNTLPSRAFCPCMSLHLCHAIWHYFCSATAVVYVADNLLDEADKRCACLRHPRRHKFRHLWMLTALLLRPTLTLDHFSLGTVLFDWVSAFDISQRTVRRIGVYDDLSAGAVFEYQICFDEALPC